MEGVIVDLSYSEDFPWTIYNRSYVHPHYKVAIELSNNRGRISWFNERCFILVSEHKTLLEVEK